MEKDHDVVRVVTVTASGVSDGVAKGGLVATLKQWVETHTWAIHALLTVRTVLHILHLIGGAHVSSVVEPSLFVFMRVIVAFPILVGIHCAKNGMVLLPSLPWGAHLELVGLAALGVPLTMIMAFEGAARTSATMLALLLPLAPIIVSTVEVIIGREKAHWARFLGLSLTTGGTILTVGFNSSSWTGGVIFIFINLAAFSCYLMLQKGIKKKWSINPLELTIHVFGHGVWQTFLVAVWYFGDFSLMTPLLWALSLYSGVFGTGLSFLVVNIAIGYVGASVVSAYLLLGPPVAAVCQTFFFNKPLTSNQLIGGAITLMGLACVVVLRIWQEKNGIASKAHFLEAEEERKAKALENGESTSVAMGSDFGEEKDDDDLPLRG